MNIERKEWEGFNGRIWKEEVNVRDFIQNNYKPYDGDESFLAGPTEATDKLWGELQKLQKEERAKGGVLDMETEVVSSLTAYGPGYIKEELKDLFALTDIVVSRAGANAICELLALHKPNLLIPLPANASRGDQLLNARSFERQGFSVVLEESEMTDETLLSAINRLYENREVYTETMKQSSQQNSIDTIIDLIESVAR